jgi:methionine synthase II (cobalamin-independent)
MHPIEIGKGVRMYRSDVVGSLLRPAYLKKAREEFAAKSSQSSKVKGKSA